MDMNVCVCLIIWLERLFDGCFSRQIKHIVKSFLVIRISLSNGSTMKANLMAAGNRISCYVCRMQVLSQTGT